MDMIDKIDSIASWVLAAVLFVAPGLLVLGFLFWSLGW